MSIRGLDSIGRLVPGQITVSGPSGVASGQILIATTSIIAGAASGGAAVNGALLTVTTSPTAGVATGGASIAGALLTVDASIIAGVAAAGSNANGAVLTTTTSIAPGVVDISQNGVIIAVQAALINGSATGGAVAGGSIVTATIALLEGAATGGAFFDTAGFISRAVQQDSIGRFSFGQITYSTDDATFTVDVSLLGGVASLGYDAQGSILDVVTSIEQGEATGGAEVPGHLFTFTVSLIDGAVFGGAAGDAGAAGAYLEVDTSIASGVASATTAPPIEQRVGGGNTFVSAPPRIDGIARGWLFVVHCDVVPGVVSGVRITVPSVNVVPAPLPVKRGPVLAFVNVGEPVSADVTGNLMSLAVLIEPGVAGTTWSENDRNDFIAMVA